MKTRGGTSGAVFVAIIFSGAFLSGQTASADGNLDCSAYTAPAPGSTLQTQNQFNQWLSNIGAGCNGTCTNGEPNQLNKVGSFTTDSNGKLSYTYDSGNTKSFSIAEKDLASPPATPPPADEEQTKIVRFGEGAIRLMHNSLAAVGDSSVYGDCFTPAAGDADKNADFYCYDAGGIKRAASGYLDKISSNSNTVFPNGISNSAPIYVLTRNPDSTKGPSSRVLLLAGKDCTMIAKSNAWSPQSICEFPGNCPPPTDQQANSKKEINTFLQTLMQYQGASPIASLLTDDSTGAYGGTSAPPSRTTGGSGPGSSSGTLGQGS